ncbi:SUN domain-containing protein 3-like [Spinachia spinachia]
MQMIRNAFSWITSYFTTEAPAATEAPPAAPSILQEIFRYAKPRGRPRNPTQRKPGTETGNLLEFRPINRTNWKTTIVRFLLMLLFAGGVMHYAYLSIQVHRGSQQMTTFSNQIGPLTPSADNMANFAQESQGARVLHRLSSDTFRTKTRDIILDKLLYWFPASKDHQKMIQDNSRSPPGECWCFAGTEGHSVVSLSHSIKVTHVTLGHITKQQSLTRKVTSAPKRFSIYGMAKEDAKGIYLGTFEYDRDGPVTQTFELHHEPGDDFSHVKLRIRSNWGDEEQTCLYNFRVHGQQVRGDWV